MWAYATFYDAGACAAQYEPDVGEAAKDLLSGADRIRPLYDSEESWRVMKASAHALADRMLHEAPVVLQHEQPWTGVVGDIEVTLYPMLGPDPDRRASGHVGRR